MFQSPAISRGKCSITRDTATVELTWDGTQTGPLIGPAGHHSSFR
jgi:hypothetical protein